MGSNFFFRHYVVAGLLTLATLTPEQGWAWGRVGHEVLNHAAIQMMSSKTAEFFRINEKSLIRISNVPDREWKKGWLARYESKTHFFQWNRYQRSPIRDNMPIPLAEAVELLGGGLHSPEWLGRLAGGTDIRTFGGGPSG